MTTWTAQVNGLAGVGTKFNVSGLTFNHSGTVFGGQNYTIWTLQNN